MPGQGRRGRRVVMKREHLAGGKAWGRWGGLRGWWGGGCLPGFAEGAEVAELEGWESKTPGGPRFWTGLQQRNLSLCPASPLPNPRMLKSP